MQIKLVREVEPLFFNTENNKYNDFTHDEFMKYLVGRYSNKERMVARWIKPNLNIVEEQKEFLEPSDIEAIKTLLNNFVDDFNKYEPYTFVEAWAIKNEALQKVVFDTLDIEEMIKNLNGERIKVDGIDVDNLVYNDDGTIKEVNKNHSNIFEVWRCDATSLNIGEEFIYALKMWCTSTDKEHYIWIDENNLDNPLDAISNTFEVHQNVLDKMVRIKRQGDILVVETSEPVEPEGELIKLTKEQYFGNLVSQS